MLLKLFSQLWLFLFKSAKPGNTHILEYGSVVLQPSWQIPFSLLDIEGAFKTHPAILSALKDLGISELLGNLVEHMLLVLVNNFKAVSSKDVQICPMTRRVISKSLDLNNE